MLTLAARLGSAPVAGFSAAILQPLAQCLRSNLRRPHQARHSRLKLGLAGLHSARPGDHRVIYRIDDQRHTVTVLAIEHRSDIYRPRQF
jgi:mRNA interferase RelE/StbE